MNDKSVMIWLKQKGWNILTSSRGGRHRQKYRYYKWSVINRNVLIVCWRTVYLTSRDLFKIQMDKSPLVKSNMQTKNGLYNSEAVQPPLLNWFNKNASSQVVTEMVLCRMTNGSAYRTLWLGRNGSAYRTLWLGRNGSE